jgi:hypothetical protein
MVVDDCEGALSWEGYGLLSFIEVAQYLFLA